MGSLRARYKVTHIPYIGELEDDYGNTVDTWGAPATVKVYGKSFPRTAEDLVAGVNRLEVDIILLTPPSFQVKARDRFTFQPPDTEDPDLFEVVGLPGDGEGNPFGWNPGGHLALRRVSG